MLYPICPTCGTLLANIQIPYQKDMEDLCAKFKVDHEELSRGELVNNKEFTEEKTRIVNKYVENICCKMRLTNFSDIVKIIN